MILPVVAVPVIPRVGKPDKVVVVLYVVGVQMVSVERSLQGEGTATVQGCVG